MAEAGTFDSFLRTAIILQRHSRGLLCGGKRVSTAALEQGRIPEEMFVVRIIRTRIEALRRAVPDVGTVGLHRKAVGGFRLLILTHAHVNVRRHVNEMAS